jgi:hypothetical protein
MPKAHRKHFASEWLRQVCESRRLHCILRLWFSEENDTSKFFYSVHGLLAVVREWKTAGNKDVRYQLKVKTGVVLSNQLCPPEGIWFDDLYTLARSPGLIFSLDFIPFPIEAYQRGHRLGKALEQLMGAFEKHGIVIERDEERNRMWKDEKQNEFLLVHPRLLGIA